MIFIDVVKVLMAPACDEIRDSEFCQKIQADGGRNILDTNSSMEIKLSHMSWGY